MTESEGDGDEGQHVLSADEGKWHCLARKELGKIRPTNGFRLEEQIVPPKKQ